MSLARTTLSPLQSNIKGVVGGHYRVYAPTSAIAPAANAVLASFRWVAISSGPQVAVILRVAATYGVVSAVTAQRMDPLGMFVQRSYTVSESTNVTAVTLTTNNGKARTTPFATSQVTQFAVASGTNGISGGTKTADANPFGIAPVHGVTAIAGLGTGMGMTDLYRHDVEQGKYPLVLGTNEGFTVQWGATALATGLVVTTIGVEWVEAVNYVG